MRHRKGFSLSLKTAKGILIEYRLGKKPFAVAVEGSEFKIEIGNETGQRVACILLVDGKNTISGKREAEVPFLADHRMWVLGSNMSSLVRGWQTSQQGANAFYFAPLPKSYATLAGSPLDDVGTVKATFVAEKPRPQPVYEAMRSFGELSGGGTRSLGAGFGASIESRTHTVEFEVGDVLAVLELGYRPEGILAKMSGFVFDDVEPLYPIEVQPADAGYCPAPVRKS